MKPSMTASIASLDLDASQFIEKLVRPHVIVDHLDAAYAEMAADEAREQEALEWSEALMTEGSDETR